MPPSVPQSRCHLEAAPKLDARLLRLPARSGVRTHPASAYCVQDGGRPGRLLRAVLARGRGWHRPPCSAGRGAGWVWAFSGWFGGTPLVEGLGWGGPRIVEAQGGEGMVSRAVGEGPARQARPARAPSLGLEAGVRRLMQLGVVQGSTNLQDSWALCWAGWGAGLCDPHSTPGCGTWAPGGSAGWASQPAPCQALLSRMETWPLVAAPGASHWTDKDGRPVQAPLVRPPLPGAAGGAAAGAPSASQGGTTCS